jgi:hypothetical protein
MWNIRLYVFCIQLCMALDLQMLLLRMEHQWVRVLYRTVYGAQLTDAPVACGTSGCACFVFDCV